jgi:hypothetical protein
MCTLGLCVTSIGHVQKPLPTFQSMCKVGHHWLVLLKLQGLGSLSIGIKQTWIGGSESRGQPLRNLLKWTGCQNV